MRRLAAVLVLFVVVAGCSKSDSSSKTTSSTSVVVTSTSVSGGTIEPGATTTTQKASGTTRLTTPEQAAAHLFLAWKDGNRAEASQFASEAAVNELFKNKYTGPEPTFEGCEQQVDHFNCGYRSEGSAMIFRVEGGASAGYRVASVDFIAD